MFTRFLNYRSLLLLTALAIISTTVWYSRYLAAQIETEERQRIEEWVQANQLKINPSQSEALNMASLITQNNSELPLIGTDEEDHILDVRNIDSATLLQNPAYFTELLASFKAQHQPIIYVISRQPYQANKIYYGNSRLLKEVQYYPIVQLVVVSLFIIVFLLLVYTRNKSTQNQVWAGLAKETAHQMGTPLTSLQGWVELLKEMPGSERVVSDMEKDVARLRLVSERFGKIGSAPQLELADVVEEIERMVVYMRRRASGRVELVFERPGAAVLGRISPPLFDWVLENLLKNALDATEGSGRLLIGVSETAGQIYIDVRDTGKGIHPANIKKVFRAGFTTKKRGWGLGLTLSKRIIEQYHKGELFVKHSEPGKGTTFRIVLNK